MTQQQPDEQQQPQQVENEDQGEQLVLTSPEEARTLKDFALWAGVILLTALTIYSPALRGDFLWDDDRHISLNRNLRSFEGLVDIWTKFGPRSGGTIQYYPLTHTTFWLEYQISGARPGEIDTRVFHTTNVVLHVIGAILLWLVLRELKVPGSWAAAAIWALHPLQVESVAWMSERKNVLAGVFFFGSVLSYLRSSMGLKGERREPDGAYFLALALFLCALLSKTMSAPVPAVILLLLWWKRGLSLKDVLATLPMFVIGLGMASLTSWIEHNQVGARGEEWVIPFGQRILIAGRAVWFYVEKNLVPLKLTFIYPRWNVPNLPASWWLFPLAVVAVIGALFALQRKLGRGPLVAFLIFCGVLVPALGFVNFYPMRYSFVADHFQYLAGPALIALVVAGVTVLLRRVAASAAAAPYFIAGLVLAALSVLTLLQTRVYLNQQTLWGDAVAKNPNSVMLQYNYGSTLLRLSDTQEPDESAKTLDQSIEHFKRATELQPKHERAWNNWGQALLLRGKVPEAMEKFDRAIALSAEANAVDIDPMMGRARALFEAKRLDESRAAFDEALAAANKLRGTGAVDRIEVATIHQHLGKIAAAASDFETGAKEYAQAVSIVGDSSPIRYEYGQLLATMARREMAAATQPSTQAATRSGVATMPATTQSTTQPTGKARELLTAAAAQLAAAIDIRPDHIDARIALANLMIDVGNLTGARMQLTAAVSTLRTLGPNAAYPPLQEAVQRWDAEFRKRESAATQATTAPAAATNPVAAELRRLQNVQDQSSSVYTRPATQPSTR